jgi:hypothetical protein
MPGFHGKSIPIREISAIRGQFVDWLLFSPKKFFFHFSDPSRHLREMRPTGGWPTPPRL